MSTIVVEDEQSTSSGSFSIRTTRPHRNYKATTSYLISQQLQMIPSHNPSYNSIIAPSLADSEPPTYFEVVNGNPSNYTKNKHLPRMLHKQPSIISSVPSTMTSATNATNFSTCTTPSNNNNNNMTYEQPKDYLAWSIFTAFYCIIIGIIAINLSLKIRQLNTNGKYQLAYTKSMLARNLNMCAVFVGFLYVTAAFLLFFVRRPF
jgi:hypothetical protein